MDIQNLSLESVPRLPDRTQIQPRLLELIRSKGYEPSWQPITVNRQSLLHQDGVIPLTPETIEEWDAELAKELFGGPQGLRKLFVHEGMIRNVDTVLMVIPRSDREKLMHYDRVRRAKQSARPKSDNEELKKQLRELGVRFKDSDPIVGGDVDVIGAEDEAVAKAVQRKRRQR